MLTQVEYEACCTILEVVLTLVPNLLLQLRLRLYKIGLQLITVIH